MIASASERGKARLTHGGLDNSNHHYRRGRYHSANQMLRLTRRTRGIIVNVVKACALGFDVRARVAIIRSVEGRSDDHEHLCQCEDQHHRTQQPSVESACCGHAIHTL